jgi:hypothetical protein
MSAATERARTRHLRFGWWSLLAFLSLGIILEGLHAFKLGWYLAPANDARRLLFTLAHAHGTLLAMLHLLFAATAAGMVWAPGRLELASRCLIGASILLPGGFLLGGLSVHDGDPGLGALLAPPGALLLFVAVFLAARSVSRG